MIQKLENGKWKGRTLNLKNIWDLTVYSKKGQNVYSSTREEKEKTPEKFVHGILSERTQNKKITKAEDLFPSSEQLKKFIKENDIIETLEDMDEEDEDE